VQGRVRQGAEEPTGEALRDGLAIGSAAFLGQVKRMAVAAGLGRDVAGKRRVAGRVTLASVIRAVERVKGEPWERFRDRHADRGAALAMRLARRYTGLTLREIGAAAGGLDSAAVSVAIKRHLQRVQTDRRLAQQERDAEQLLLVDSAEKPPARLTALPSAASLHP
jgi:hypothetical protein